MAPPDRDVIGPVTCLCGEGRTQVVMTVGDPFCADPRRFQVAECLRCGLARTLDGPEGPERARWYADHYGAHQAEALRHRGLLRRAWQRLTGMHPYDILARMPGGESLLEVGCGAGDVLEPLSARYRRVLGLEPDPGSARRATARGLRVVAGDVDTFDPGAERFSDLLFAFVLEHLADPVAALTRVRGWLRPGGRLHVFCPDYASPHRAELGEHWALWHVPYQRWFFCRKSLAEVLQRAGFACERVRSYSRGGVQAMGEELRRRAAAASAERGFLPASGRLHELAIRCRGIRDAWRNRGDCLAVRARPTLDAGQSR